MLSASQTAIQIRNGASVTSRERGTVLRKRVPRLNQVCALADVAHPASTQTVTIRGAATFKSVQSGRPRIAARDVPRMRRNREG